MKLWKPFVQRVRIWAGDTFGFFQEIEDLERANGELSTTIEGMHAYYLKEYRRVEKRVTTIAKIALPELRLSMVRHLVENGLDFSFRNAGTLMMAHTSMNTEARFDEETCRTVTTASLCMGFAFDSAVKGTGVEQYKVALGFAATASDMAYDAVMKDLGQRPSPAFNP